jgi:hypothetical protein
MAVRLQRARIKAGQLSRTRVSDFDGRPRLKFLSCPQARGGRPTGARHVAEEGMGDRMSREVAGPLPSPRHLAIALVRRAAVKTRKRRTVAYLLARSVVANRWGRRFGAGRRLRAAPLSRRPPEAGAGMMTGMPEGGRAPVMRLSSASPDRTRAECGVMSAVAIIRSISRRCLGSTRVTTVPDSPARAVRPPRCR